MAKDRSASSGRILYLITSDISARFLRGQLAHLVSHGFDVAVATNLSDPPASFDAGVDVFELSYEREPSPLADLRALRSTVTLIRRERPDVVNASTPKAGLIGMISAWLCRVPRRVYVVRGLRFETMQGVRRRLFVWIERITTACATDVIYNSPSLRSVAETERAVRRNRGVVLAGGSGNGIDVSHYDELPSRQDARQRFELPADARVVGFIGRLTRDKGIIDLIDTIDELDGDTMLLLAGDFEQGDPVPAAVRTLIDEDPRISHIPWVDDPRTLYPALDVLAFPSYREGLPNVPLEAQLCGVPVVAYAATGTVDAMEHGVGGVLVPVGDRHALAQALRAMLNDPASAVEAPAAAREWVDARFSRSAVWSALVTLLDVR